MFRFASALVACLVILGLTGLYSVAQSPSETPDPSATFRTIIAHRDAIPVPAPLTEFPQENEPLLPNFLPWQSSNSADRVYRPRREMDRGGA